MSSWIPLIASVSLGPLVDGASSLFRVELGHQATTGELLPRAWLQGMACLQGTLILDLERSLILFSFYLFIVYFVVKFELGSGLGLGIIVYFLVKFELRSETLITFNNERQNRTKIWTLSMNNTTHTRAHIPTEGARISKPVPVKPF